MSQPLIDSFEEFLDYSFKQKASGNFKAGQFIYPLEKIIINKSSKNIFPEAEAQFFWRTPKKNRLFHSIGRINFQKVFSFNQLIFNKKTLGSIKEVVISNRKDEILEKVPLFLGNSEFAPFNESSMWGEYFNINWFIPKLLLIFDKTNSFLVYYFSLENEKKIILDEFERFSNIINSSDSASPLPPRLNSRRDLDFQLWKDLVDKALGEIEKGSFSKVVLSRMTEFRIDGELGYEELNKIADQYPDCVTFVNKNDGSLFFGITPETLLKISGGVVETESLAGSIKRSGNSMEDKLLSEQLLNSGKNLHEQKVVTNYIYNKLEAYCEDISFNREPELIKLENIQHLKTQFKARMKENKFFFDLVKELHPTPAVCGFPKETARNFILNNEGYERGLYSGIAGWFNLFNEGEFAVAIRSALITKKKLYAFSGCGIVEGSDPQSEYEETEIKLKPILSIFGYEN